MYRTFVLPLALALAAPPAAWADARTQLLREASEQAFARIGIRTATREATDALARQITASAAKHGDQVIAACRQVGPKALRLVEEAGAHSPQLGARAAGLLAREGEAAAFILTRPKSLAQFAQFGGDGAAALLKHKAIGEGLIEAAGQPAVTALKSLAPQSGRRLAMLAAEGGETAQLARSPEMLGILAKYGDPACDFLWRNKGALAVAGIGASFIANPEPYLNGTKDLAGIVAQNAVKPIAQSTNWTLIFTLVLLAGGALAAHRFRLIRRLLHSSRPPVGGKGPSSEACRALPSTSASAGEVTSPLIDPERRPQS